VSNLIAIATVEAKAAADALPGSSLEDRARAAMRAVQHHWLVTDPDQQFLAACEGLAQSCKQLGQTEDFDRIVEDAERIARGTALMQALISGVPVAWDEIEPSESPANPLGLKNLWIEVSG
jgi:hypothetical protein